jgi:hypothetical protein
MKRNKNYLIRAFLMNNKRYTIEIYAQYLHTVFPESFTALPLCYKNRGGNLWLKKTL